MNLSEFKAWFEGFTDGIDSNPTEKQWEKIKAKVAEIKAEPTSPVVIREYINNYRRYWSEPYWYGSLSPYATMMGIQAASSSAGLISEKLSGKPVVDYVEPFGGDGRINEATFRAMGAADREALN